MKNGFAGILTAATLLTIGQPAVAEPPSSLPSSLRPLPATSTLVGGVSGQPSPADTAGVEEPHGTWIRYPYGYLWENFCLEQLESVETHTSDACGSEQCCDETPWWSLSRTSGGTAWSFLFGWWRRPNCDEVLCEQRGSSESGAVRRLPEDPESSVPVPPQVVRPRELGGADEQYSPIRRSPAAPLPGSEPSSRRVAPPGNPEPPAPSAANDPPPPPRNLPPRNVLPKNALPVSQPAADAESDGEQPRSSRRTWNHDRLSRFIGTSR